MELNLVTDLIKFPLGNTTVEIEQVEYISKLGGKCLSLVFKTDNDFRFQDFIWFSYGYDNVLKTSKKKLEDILFAIYKTCISLQGKKVSEIRELILNKKINAYVKVALNDTGQAYIYVYTYKAVIDKKSRKHVRDFPHFLIRRSYISPIYSKNFLEEDEDQ